MKLKHLWKGFWTYSKLNTKENRMNLKAGFKTTEFYTTIGSILTNLVAAFDVPEYGVYGLIANALIAAAYSISRGLAKKPKR